MRDAQLGFYDEVTGLYLTAPRANLVMRAKGACHRRQLRCRCDDFRQRTAMSPPISPCRRTRARSRQRQRSPDLDLRGAGRATPRCSTACKTLPLVASASTQFRVEPGGKLACADFDITAAGEIPFARAEEQGAACRQSAAGRAAMTAQAHHLALTTRRPGRQAKRGRVLKGAGDFFYDADGKLEQVACRSDRPATSRWTCRACSRSRWRYQIADAGGAII